MSNRAHQERCILRFWWLHGDVGRIVAVEQTKLRTQVACLVPTTRYSARLSAVISFPFLFLPTVAHIFRITGPAIRNVPNIPVIVLTWKAIMIVLQTQRQEKLSFEVCLSHLTEFATNDGIRKFHPLSIANKTRPQLCFVPCTWPLQRSIGNRMVYVLCTRWQAKFPGVLAY